MKKVSKKADEFWQTYSKKQLSPISLMNLETDRALSERKFEEELEHFNRVVAFGSEDVVVDLGGGIGLWSEYFSRYVGKVVLLEKQKEFVDVARKRIADGQVGNIEVVQDDVVSCDLEPESVDKVFISGVTIYLEDDELTTLAKKISVALKPDGELIHRDSYGREGRYVIDNKFSEKLGLIYSAVYRSIEEYDSAFSESGGLKKIYDEDMYKEGSQFNKWQETRIRFAVYKKEE